MRSKSILATMLLLGVNGPCLAELPRPTNDFSKTESDEAMVGGSATYSGALNTHAFSHPADGLSSDQQQAFKRGKGFFRRVWTASPASNDANDGLGPLFNARSCQSCHPRNGRGQPRESAYTDTVSTVLHLGIVPGDAVARYDHNGAAPEPTYGEQLQTRAVAGVPPEGRLVVRYSEVPVLLGDGESVRLRAPSYSVADLGYGAMAPGTRLSPRVAPQLVGLGLMEAIAPADLLSLADPEDGDGDGISGRPNMVWSPAEQRIAIGRFGWKAGAASVNEFAQRAFSNDLGISVPLYPNAGGDCSDRQAACQAAPNGNTPRFDGLEATRELTDLVTLYLKTLAVPARRQPGHPDVLAGKALFYTIGCSGCHIPKFRIPLPHKQGAQPGALIWPYTDLLLHDMGDGLADELSEGDATGHEWRTAPLWGIGLTALVNGHEHYLHDGRAGTLQEAILWHGGEAQRSRDAFSRLPATQRRQILQFIHSL